MDFLGNIADSINNFLFPDKNDGSPREQTYAPENINPMNYDITDRTLIVEVIPDDRVNLQPPEEVKDLFDQLFDSLPKLDGGEGSGDYDDFINANITTMSFNDGEAETMVKITEDLTGRTVEVVQEVTTDIVISDISTEISSTSLKTMSDNVTDMLNMTSKSSSVDDNTNYINVYIMVALFLLILIALCGGLMIWCKKNKLKAIKRNAAEYPVTPPCMNNKLSNTEKLKNIP